ncbi:MAG: hypothetical protein ABII82_06140 [Verrucomicrobiota bacterium]
MSSSSLPTSLPSGDDRNLVQVDDSYVAPGLEDRLQLFWERYSRVIIIGVVVVVIAISGRGLVGWMSARQDAATRAEFATVEGKDALLAFAAAHPSHALAGVALLQVADELYAAGDFTGAGAAYRDAAASLGDQPLAGRALLGAAISVIQAGKTAEGVAVLRQLADDVARTAVTRAEAAYHLASLARESGQIDEAGRRVEQIAALGETGVWGQRALMLREQLATAATATGDAAVAPAAGSAEGEAESTVSFSAP